MELLPVSRYFLRVVCFVLNPQLIVFVLGNDAIAATPHRRRQMTKMQRWTRRTTTTTMLGGKDEDAGNEHDGDENNAGGDEVHRLPLHDGHKDAARVPAGGLAMLAGEGRGVFASFRLV